MKSFACGDVIPGCEARWVCSTEDEVMFEVAQHAAAVHGISSLSPDTANAVHAAMVTVAA
jgi:predicted small metal-binding protein